MKRSRVRFACTRPRKVRGPAVLVMLLAALILVVGGCRVVSYDLHSNEIASSDHLMTINMRMLTDSTQPLRGTIAFRIPQEWDVTSVAFTGALSGNAVSSTNIADYFGSVWEAAPPDQGHNGHKNGYKWWGGYSPAKQWYVDDEVTVVIHLNTHGRGGTYWLDFVFGWTTQNNPATETGGDRSNWEYGAVDLTGIGGPAFPGVLLDAEITLYCFSDVLPGHPHYTAIQHLGWLGVISGYGPASNGSYEFRGSNPVFRAQYAKFIVNGLTAAGATGFTVAEGMTPPVNFPDLGPDNPGDLYPHEYVWVAYLHNITKGYANGNFQPYIPISRAHVITMTVRALQGLPNSYLTNPPPGYVGPMGWGNDMLPEHQANARIAEFHGLLAGIGASSAANGNGPMPRQEVAQIMSNVIDLVNVW